MSPEASDSTHWVKALDHDQNVLWEFTGLTAHERDGALQESAADPEVGHVVSGEE